MSYFASPYLAPLWTVLGPTAGDASGRLIIKASGGNLRRLTITNTSLTTGYYVQLHNAAAVGSIVTGTRRWESAPLPAGGYLELDFGDAALSFSTGIAVALSSTNTTYTAVVDTGDFSAQYA